MSATFSSPQNLSPRQLGWVLLAAGLLNTMLWLQSLDIYLDTRWQWRLQSVLPAAAFTPSRQWASWWGRAVAVVDPEPPIGQGPAPLLQPLQALPVGEFWPTLAQQKALPGPQRMLFAGDSMMQGVAPLVMRELAQAHPDWQLTDLSQQSTGLTARRYFDWPRTIAKAIETQQLTWVVIFLGPNDPRDMFLPDKRVSFATADWLQHYAARVDEILAHAHKHQVRVLWLGLPAMREDRLQRGVQVLNHVFHDRASAFGTDYLATEPLIGVASLPFQKYQRDATGPSVSLRTEDGTHFTPAGLRKITQAVVAHIEKAVQP
jgi:uncharacterized protein